MAVLLHCWVGDREGHLLLWFSRVYFRWTWPNWEWRLCKSKSATI